MNRFRLHGVIPALVTPFDEGDVIDEAGVHRLVEHVVSGGVHGIMTTGGTGEFPSLSRDERRQATAVMVEAAAGRVPIIAGTAACSTKEAIELSRDAVDVGADAVIVTAPFYFPLPESALRAHYHALAGAIDVPLVAYNNPLYTKNPLRPALLAQLAEDGVIAGVKQSEANLGELVELISLVDGKIDVLTGIDSQFVAALSVGSSGIFTTAATVVPELMVRIYDRFIQGDGAEAARLQMELQSLNRFFEYEPGYVAPCKRALELLGLPGGAVRAPLPELTEAEDAALQVALDGLRGVAVS